MFYTPYSELSCRILPRRLILLFTRKFNVKNATLKPGSFSVSFDYAFEPAVPEVYMAGTEFPLATGILFPLNY